MPGFELPRNLMRDVEAYDEPDSARRKWLAELPRTVGELAQRWSLELGRPFQPGGVTAWVAPARNVAGEHLVLKVGWCHDEALHEPDGLRAWDGDGAPSPSSPPDPGRSWPGACLRRELDPADVTSRSDVGRVELTALTAPRTLVIRLVSALALRLS